MSKLSENKGFKAGLESLLLDAMKEDDVLKDQPFAAESKQVKKARKSSNSGKSFAQDLSSLFETTIVESVQEKVKALKDGSDKGAKKKNRKPPTGLDVLIRRTVESSQVDIENGPKRRVTFLFDEEKLKRLKGIAKEKKSYIKDIVGDIVSEFIEEYEKGNLGNDEIRTKKAE
ncbi:MAG: hypothetical protein AAF849_06700 [Bacteroidota bacterium]